MSINPFRKAKLVLVRVIPIMRTNVYNFMTGFRLVIQIITSFALRFCASCNVRGLRTQKAPAASSYHNGSGCPGNARFVLGLWAIFKSRFYAVLRFGPFPGPLLHFPARM